MPVWCWALSCPSSGGTEQVRLSDHLMLTRFSLFYGVEYSQGQPLQAHELSCMQRKETREDFFSEIWLYYISNLVKLGEP